ncbi:MAG: uracil-DNA glycosylase family protein [Sphingomonas sp.]
MPDLDVLLARVRACDACGDALPLGPRPVLQLSSTAKILIASQAPGTRVHASGIPFDDPSGDRLRAWMGLTKEEFYDASRIAILPMGLCYPGRSKQGGDAPPRPECAPLWRDLLLDQLPALSLTLLVGTYAQNHVLGSGRMAERVRSFHFHLPDYFPLPHPSWRSGIWATRNPWFEADVVPQLRREISKRMSLAAPVGRKPTRTVDLHAKGKP